MSTAARLIALPFLAAAALIGGAWLLFWTLIGPVGTVLLARWLLGPDSTVYEVTSIACLVWGVYGLWHWWSHFRSILARMTRKPARRRRRR